MIFLDFLVQVVVAACGKPELIGEGVLETVQVERISYEIFVNVDQELMALKAAEPVNPS